MDTLFKFDVHAERVDSHALLHWSNPIVGFGSLDVCLETGTILTDEVNQDLTYKIIRDWLRPVTTPIDVTICHEIVEYERQIHGVTGTVVTYVFKDEDTSEYEKNRIIITSSHDETIIHQGVFKQRMDNVYQARRYVKEYLTSAGVTVLQR